MVPEDQAMPLRDSAMVVLKRGGRLKVGADGVSTWIYGGPEIRISYQPAISGASMPSMIDIWLTTGTAKVFIVYWFQDGSFEVIRHKSGPWEDTLRQLAGLELPWGAR